MLREGLQHDSIQCSRACQKCVVKHVSNVHLFVLDAKVHCKISGSLQFFLGLAVQMIEGVGHDSGLHEKSKDKRFHTVYLPHCFL